jgi:hypothetical protein
MSKTRFEDLVVINYRSQGVAEEISETQQTMLVKLIMLGVRSEKGLRLDLDVKI